MSEPIEIPVLAIDGPSGVGKGTMSQMLARELKWHLLDSGALYRVLAVAALRRGVDLQSEEALSVLAAHMDLEFNVQDSSQKRMVIFEGENVTDEIRTEVCGQNASLIAQFPSVRAALLQRQRSFRKAPGLVADGRDMGTVVFPDAILKIFLVASQEERANRRYLQLKKKGKNVSIPEILSELEARDERDKNRSVAPLVAADDAVVIDTTSLTIEQVFAQIMLNVHNTIPV